MTPIEEEGEDIYCPTCGHCGDICCCGIYGFLEKHVKGKTNCLYETEILEEIKKAWRHHLLPSAMKYWIDDERPAPDASYVHLHTVYEALDELMWLQNDAPNWLRVEVIDLDHDAGEFSDEGGDYIEILKAMEENGWKYPVAFHTMNPVGRANMQRIAEKNGWRIKQSEWRGECAV